MSKIDVPGPRRPARAALLACLALAATVDADVINPRLSETDLCPDGKPRLEWSYPFEDGIPENATPVEECPDPEGCWAFPQSACLSMHEVSRPLGRRDAAPVLAGNPPPQPVQPDPPPAPSQPLDVTPTHPTGFEVLPRPTIGCVDGTGWDFEELRHDAAHKAFLASLDGWEGGDDDASPWRDRRNADVDYRAAPVYGNAAPIENIRPPGFSPLIASQIGGDYWRYSQPVNAHGNFWLSSMYRRYSWKQHPGDAWGEAAYGVVRSPACWLNARYLTFRMGGARSSRQRVELQVWQGDPAGYWGVRFPGGPGDFTLGEAFGHATQQTSTPSAPAQHPPSTSGWVTLRTVTPENPPANADSDWMQTYVFDLRDFEQRDVRIRVVDDVRQECAAWFRGFCLAPAKEHINVDDFRFHDRRPTGVRWMEYDRDKCCAPIGRVPSEPALWGVTDAHAHPMANLGFGGHVVWGDVADTLPDTYDCSRSLPPIGGPGGRPALTEPAHVAQCYLSGDILVIVTAIVQAGCGALVVVPVVGVTLASVCKSVMSAATVGFLTTPLIRGLSLHGAQKFASGAFEFGLVFSEAWSWFVALNQILGDPALDFTTGLMAAVDAWPGAQSQLAWYERDADWHSLTGLGKTHNLYQADMIRRAYQGGLRLGVWDVVNSRALALVADGNPHASDWQALQQQTDAAQRIVGGALKDIAAIAYTPDEAEQIIRSGRMAVILGTEVDELGRARPAGLPWPRSPHTPGDSMRKQIDDLWELGIRKISPVHAVNNPVGGAAIFSAQYVANNHYLNGTPLDGEPSFVDLLPVRFAISRTPWLPFRLTLGKFAFGRRVGDDGVQPWNPRGWFELDTREQLDPLIGGPPVTWRIGQEKAPDNKLRGAGGAWLPPANVLGKQVLLVDAMAEFSALIRPVGRCDLFNTVVPDHAKSFGPEVDDQFVTATGHRNLAGIFRNGTLEDGEGFLRAAMKKGLLIDVDHMSENMRAEVYRLGQAYGSEARSSVHYPFMGVHTTVRGLEKEGSSVEHVVWAFGADDESTRTQSEIEWVGAHGGLVGVFPRGSAFIPPNTAGQACYRDTDCASGRCDAGRCTAQPPELAPLAVRAWDLPREVANDCDTSSKTFAVKYLWLMQHTRGRGLTFTSDLNGLIGTISPRFGRATPGKEACGGNKRALLGDRWAGLQTAGQIVEHSGVWYSDYTAASTPSVTSAGWSDPDPLPHHRWRQVIARGGTAVREDRAPRWPIHEEVFFNDHGPDIPRHWYDQDANRPGAQLAPLKRWSNLYSGWDFNLDGLQHIGLLPDLMQDLRNVGVQWEQLGPLFRGAGDFIEAWRRAVELGQAHP